MENVFRKKKLLEREFIILLFIVSLIIFYLEIKGKSYTLHRLITFVSSREGIYSVLDHYTK